MHQHNFYDYASEIDKLITHYSTENLSKIEATFKKEGLVEYFFKKLASAQNPLHWLKPLKEKGYFNPGNNPKPKEVTDKPLISYWNVLDYLENVAKTNEKAPSEEVTNTLIEIVNLIIEYRDENNERVDNYRTDWFMLKIISTFPVDKIEDKHFSFIRDALNSKWRSILVAGGIRETILPKLIKHTAKDHLLRLLDIMFSFREVEKYGKEHESLMEDYWLNESLKKYKRDIFRICGIEAADIALNKIKLIVEKNDSYFSNMWIPAIEDHPQNRNTDKYECILVHFVRDVYEQTDTNQVKEKIENLLKEKYPIFKRIAVYIINHHYSELNYLFWKWDGNPLDEYGLKHEIYEFLKNNCTSFNDSHIDKLLEWIELKDYYISDEIKGDEEKKNIILAYRKREWLSALLKANNPKVNEKYEQYKLINPAELDHPGFDHWMEVGWVGHVSPKTPEELNKMTNSEIANFVKDFKGERGWNTPTIDGLIDALRNCVSNNPEKFSKDIEPFLNVQRMYQHALFWGLWEAWRNKKVFNWIEILAFILKIIELDSFWNEQYEKERYNYRDSIISQIAELINEGTRDDSHAFDPALLPEAEKILRILVEKAESRLSDMGDILTSVLNSTKGKIFSAMVNYSLRYARLFKKGEEEKWVESIKKDFTKRLDRGYEPSPEFSVILGEYLPNLYYLDKKWVIDNFNSIFLKDNKNHWRATFTGYLYSASTVYKEIYDLLKDKNHYEKAIGENFENIHIKERLVQHVCIGYLEGWEKLKDANSLISKLIGNRNTEQLSEIVSFFWMLRGKPINKAKIKPLWKVIFKIVSQKTSDADFRKIISNLSRWLSLIDEIDDDIYEWLKLSAKYVQINHNTSFFVEYLAEHVERKPEKVGKLYLEMVDAGVFPDHDEEHIQKIIRILYEKGQKDIAGRICIRYGEEGYDFSFMRELYEKYKKEES